jgi:hypothetical protein
MAGKIVPEQDFLALQREKWCNAARRSIMSKTRHAVGTAADLVAMARCGTAFATGAQQAAGEMSLFASRRYASGLRGLTALMKCRTPDDLIAAHAALVCEDIELALASGARLAEIVAATAGGAVRSLES